MVYARVIVKQRTNVNDLTYSVPATIIPYIKPGIEVKVPLKNRVVDAVVVELLRSVPKELRLRVKEIMSIDKNNRGYLPGQIETMKLLAGYYGASLAEVGFHALKQPQPLNKEMPKKTRPKPTYLVTGWQERGAFYQKLIAREGKEKRVLLLFAQLSYLQDFVAGLRVAVKKEVIVADESASSRRALGKLIESNLPGVILGTVGDAFLPLRPGDVIIVDEPDAPGAAQLQRPYMSTKIIARFRAQAESLKLFYAAELIALEDYQHVKDSWQVIRKLSATRSLAIFNRRGSGEILLPSLVEEIGQALTKQQKVVVLVGSKTWSPAVVCLECQQTLACANCGRVISLKSPTLLECQYCGHQQKVPSVCPDCGGKVKAVGEGLDQIKNFLTSRFPKAAVAQLTADQPDLPKNWQILVATERILSFPSLRFETAILAGVDRFLLGNKLDGSWRLLQLLLRLQEKAKNISLQTLLPDHWVWSAFTSPTLEKYYGEELKERRKYRLPPFGQEYRLITLQRQITLAEAQYRQLSEKIEQDLPVTASPLSIDRRLKSGFVFTGYLFAEKPLTVVQKEQLRDLTPPAWFATLG